MATVSFKTDDDFKDKLDSLADKKGINTSAYIKLILTKGVNEDLTAMTQNGLTVGEELAILGAEKKGKTYGPFKTAKALMKSLKK